MIVARIEVAEPCLFLVVAGDQFGSEGGDLLLERGPFAPAAGAFGLAGLQAALVLVGAGIADVLVAVGLGKEQRQADAARGFRVGCIEALGARDRPPEIDDVLERRRRILRIGGRSGR